jgi:hypothetical protein
MKIIKNEEVTYEFILTESEFFDLYNTLNTKCSLVGTAQNIFSKMYDYKRKKEEIEKIKNENKMDNRTAE